MKFGVLIDVNQYPVFFWKASLSSYVDLDLTFQVWYI